MDKKLNKEQKKAVEHGSGPMLIIAGAGTGKTTVITERIKYLISKKNVDPSKILALTFTEKAAGEMEERIDQVMPLSYSQIFIGTFHGFCDKVLKEEGISIGLDTGYRLLSQAESVALLKEKIHELELSYFKPTGNPQKFLYGLTKHFSRLADEMIGPEDYEKFYQEKWGGKKKLTEEEKLEKEKIGELVGAYRIYGEIKAERGVMDFADLISKTIELFLKRKNILAEYRKRFTHVLVDEYQDTNIAQNRLVEMLCPPQDNPNLFVVGDDSQSIYKFRGAAVSNILSFIDTYKDSQRVVLTKNYRSSQAILDAAYRLIKHNDPDTLEAKMGISKNLLSVRGEPGKEVEFYFEKKVEDEAQVVVEKIKELKEKNKKWTWSDMAILARANNHSESFLESLNRAGVPYQFLGPGHLLKEPEVKDLVAYLQLLVDLTDDIAAFRVLSSEQIGLDQRDLVLMRGYLKKQGISYYEMIKKIVNWDYETVEKLKFGQISQKPPVVDEETRYSLEKFLKMFEKHLKMTGKESGGQILYYYLADTDYLDKLVSPQNEKTERAVEKISALFEKIKIFESNREEKGVKEVLDWLLMQLELGEDSIKKETEEEAINILTVHSAKGLEFEVVFMVNLVDQRFPTRKRGEEIPLPEELIKEILPEGDVHEQEERRLFYVGMTRAKSKLFLTGAKSYNEESKREKKVSIFVKEALGEDFEIKSQEKKEQMSLLGWEKEEEQEMKREKADFWVVNYLSYSQMDSFAVCPKQYRYRYILNLPSPPSAAQILGTAVHQTLKDFYQETKSGEFKGEEKEILELLDKNWQSSGFDNKKHEEDTRKKAEEILVWFYKDCFDREKIKEVLVLEQPFSLRLSPSLKVGGVIDRIDQLADEEIEIIDYKTGGKIPSQKEVDENEQLTVYALAASEIPGIRWNKQIEKIKLSLWFLDGQQKVSTRRKAEDIEKMRERIIETAQNMSGSDFPAKANRPFPCDFCAYRLICDAWK